MLPQAEVEIRLRLGEPEPGKVDGDTPRPRREQPAHVGPVRRRPTEPVQVHGGRSIRRAQFRLGAPDVAQDAAPTQTKPLGNSPAIDAPRPAATETPPLPVPQAMSPQCEVPSAYIAAPAPLPNVTAEKSDTD